MESGKVWWDAKIAELTRQVDSEMKLRDTEVKRAVKEVRRELVTKFCDKATRAKMDAVQMCYQNNQI